MGSLKNMCFMGIIYSILINDLKLAKEATFYEVTAFTSVERAALYKLHVENSTIIFLNSISNVAFFKMSVVVVDFCDTIFETTLQMKNIEYSIFKLGPTFDDLDKNVIPGEKFISSINNFQDYDEIQENINKIVKENSIILSKHTIASTYEQSNLTILKLIRNPDNPAVFIISGEQGSDWVSPAVLINFLHKMLADESGLMELTEYYNFHFALFANPDGYKFSMTKNRYWTKNRNVFFPRKKCGPDRAIGVNIDRNWFFGENHGDKCHSVYLGPTSLSEIESKAFAQYINTIAHKLMAFINLRGLGQRLLSIPYGHTKEYSVNHNVMMAILRSASKKVENEHNVKYLYGQTSKYIWNSCDWVKKYLNVPIVYMVHLKSNSDLFPNTEDIEPLSNHVTTIIQDTLSIGQKIYGPLFNKQNMKLVPNKTVTIVLLIKYLFK